jgi:4-amino-4-deoxy-L-arabinose transferase-like glycosyltransferase
MDILLNNRRRLTFALLALFFSFGLFDHSLWSANDSREGAMIREMYREGIWVAPVFNGRYYLEKPPLLHWTALLFCHAAGTVNEGLVRLPAALFGFGAVILIWLWGRGLGREAAGIAAAFMCATSVLFVEYTRIVLTDAALTFMVLGSLYLFWRAWIGGGRWFVYLPFLLMSAAAFYAKGLIGPGLIWVAVSAFLLSRRQWKRWLGLGLLFIPIAAAITAPWLAALWKVGGKDYLYTVLWANQFGRYLVFSDTALPADPFFVHKEPWTYYLIHVWERLLPWTLLVLPALWRWFQGRAWLAADSSAGSRRISSAPQTAVFLRIMLAAMFLVLQLSAAKADSYLLPLFPVLFLMTGVWLEDAAEKWKTKVESWLIGLTVAALALAAGCAPLIYWVLFLGSSDLVWIPNRPAVFVSFGLACLALGTAVGAGGLLWRQFQAGQRARALLNVPPLAAVLLALNAAVFIPAYDYQRTYQPFAELVRSEMRQGRRIALVGDRERDCGAFMFYLNMRLPVLSTADRVGYANFLDGNAGLIVARQDLGGVARLLAGRSFPVLQCGPCGYKSAGFYLVINTADRDLNNPGKNN